MKLSEIKPNPSNPRLIKDEKFEKLKQSIKDFPQMMELRPMIVDEGNVLLGGNMRFKALQDLGYKDIPKEWVKKASELTEEQKKEFIIKDNVGFGEWQWDALANEWDVEQLTEWGLDVPDYAIAQPEAVEDDYVIPDTIETDIVLGDLFEIGGHRLLCGDSTDSDAVARLMNGQKADMVFTDPPYGMKYGGGRAKGDNVKNKKTGGVLIKAHGEILGDDLTGESLVQMIKDALLNGALFKKNGGSAYICFTWRTYSEFEDALIAAGYTPKACIVWNKKSIGLGFSDYRPQHEFIFYCDGQWYGEKNESDVWELSRGATGEYVHPTQKPIELVARALKNSSKDGDIVLELFTGSGSTMVAAHQLNRKCYGMELDPKYCQVIIDRMLKLDPNIEIVRNGVKYAKNSEITANG